MKRLKATIWTAAGALALAALALAPAAHADQVILDDLIVNGSVCAGQDCVNGESFGFDTLRLKENNLRIKFQDTSTSASFPTNDWQITANDSSNGGANKFSIDDIDGGRTPFTIEAGSPSHSLYVDASKRVGFGTNSPVVDLHVVSGNTPTLRLEQNGSSGFAAQTWDVAGNEAGFFIRDATNGSTLPLRIRPAAPSSSIDIAPDGDVGMGASSPSRELHVRRTDASDTFMLVENTNGTSQTVGVNFLNTSGVEWTLRNSSNGQFVLRETGGGAANIHLTIDPNTDAWTVLGDITANSVLLTSSREKKQEFSRVDSREILAKVAALPISEWSFKSDLESARHIGPMAEDFHAAFQLEGQEPTTLSMTDVNGVTLAAVQALYQQGVEKDARIETLEQRLATLEEMILELTNE